MKNLALFFLIILFPSLKVLAQTEPLVLINQVLIEKSSGAKHELVELYNPNQKIINLNNFSLQKKTASGKTSNLVSAKNFKGEIPPQGYFLIASPELCDEIACDLKYSSQASLAKNNTLILYNQNNKIIDKLGWGETNDYYTKPAPNPAKDQVLKRVKYNNTSPNNQIDYNLENTNIKVRNSQGKIIKIKLEAPAKKKREFKNISLKNIKNTSDKDYVKVTGIVSVLPGTLGLQYFYIHDQYDNDKNIYGLQIYNYHKIFPEIKIGDRIEVRGQISVTGQEPLINYKIKTKEANDIKIISSNNKTPSAELIKISELKPQQLGQIKKIKGEITQNKSNQIYLDDGQNEILIDIRKNTNIPRHTLKEGEFFTISGLLREKSKTLSLCPLSLSDIESEKNLENEQNDILMPESWTLEKKNDKNSFFKYLITLSIILGLLFLFKIVKI